MNKKSKGYGRIRKKIWFEQKKYDDAVDAPGVMGRTKDMSTYVRE